MVAGAAGRRLKVDTASKEIRNSVKTLTGGSKYLFWATTTTSGTSGRKLPIAVGHHGRLSKPERASWVKCPSGATTMAAWKCMQWIIPITSSTITNYRVAAGVVGVHYKLSTGTTITARWVSGTMVADGWNCSRPVTVLETITTTSRQRSMAVGAAGPR